VNHEIPEQMGEVCGARKGTEGCVGGGRGNDEGNGREVRVALDRPDHRGHGGVHDRSPVAWNLGQTHEGESGSGCVENGAQSFDEKNGEKRESERFVIGDMNEMENEGEKEDNDQTNEQMKRQVSDDRG
jgi:hypothetical protein